MITIAIQIKETGTGVHYEMWQHNPVEPLAHPQTSREKVFANTLMIQIQGFSDMLSDILTPKETEIPQNDP